MSAIYDELVTLIVWIDWTTFAETLKSESGCGISKKLVGSREKVEKTRIDVTWEHNSSISGNDETKLCGWKPVRISGLWHLNSSELSLTSGKKLFRKRTNTKNLSPLHVDGRMEKWFQFRDRGSEDASRSNLKNLRRNLWNVEGWRKINIKSATATWWCQTVSSSHFLVSSHSPTWPHGHMLAQGFSRNGK